MTPALANLQPQAVWKHFERLAAIPRASTKEAAAREYVLALAVKLGLESVQGSRPQVHTHSTTRPDTAPDLRIRHTSWPASAMEERSWEPWGGTAQQSAKRWARMGGIVNRCRDLAKFT